MKSLSVLRSHFGQVHLNFGEPIKLVDYLDQHNSKWRNETVAAGDNPPPGSNMWCKNWVRKWSNPSTPPP